MYAPAHGGVLDLRRHRRGGIRRDDLFAGEIPPIPGRRSGHHHGAQHQGGDHLDHHSGHHPGGHGGARRRSHPEDGGHAQFANCRSGSPAINGSGSTSTWMPARAMDFFSTLEQDSNFARQLNSGIDPNTVPNYLLDVDKPMVIPSGTKVRLLLTSHGCHPRMVGARFRREALRHSRVSSTNCGSRSMPARKASIAGNARRCAAATTASCRSSSTCAPPTISRNGSTNRRPRPNRLQRRRRRRRHRASP